METITQSLPIAVRAYAAAPSPPTASERRRTAVQAGPSPWSLTWDTETATDAAQQLRFGAYQLRHADALREQGLFYDPRSLSAAERSTLHIFAAARGFAVRTVAEFVEEVFFPSIHELGGLCIGFNLPFDLSRLAIGHDSARGTAMRGGFSFQLSNDPRRPRVQVKHLNSRAALIRLTLPPEQRTSRGMRRRGLKVPGQRGHFVDVRTLAGALLSGSWSLERLADHLKTKHRKQGTEEHGGPLTAAYLGYATDDVQVTWECFATLRAQYERYRLTETPLTRIYSEASLGKACLRQMGIRPWRKVQPDVPPALLGIIMSTYYGGRSEVHLRRVIGRVLYCDFLSMYPTVCTLMGLWRFVIAQGMAWDDDTAGVQAFLARVTLADLQRPEAWHALTALVQVQPDGDVFPVRAKYGDEGQYTIGLNRLTSEQPLWFTLADCITSTLLTDKPPKVVRALRFRPVGVQGGLRPLDIAGNSAYRIAPAADDFYRRLIDLRTEVKGALKRAQREGDDGRATALDAEQLALKITANATSYGILVELNVNEGERPQDVHVYGPGEEGFPAQVHTVEEPGPYFHPLLATLITGAARLMLALAERLATEAGITWAFCDTDSMALAQPEGLDGDEFLARAQRVREWFTPLNPYAHQGPVFKVEDANYRLAKGKRTDDLEPLYCLAISAKRYALFNRDGRGRPVLRKASAHGLGHLRPPYAKDHAPRSIPRPVVTEKDLGVERWQHDVWYRIVQAALGDHPEQVRLADLPGFDRPAVSRYAATTPQLLRWFKDFNRGKPYREQVRPFGFLHAFQAAPLQEAIVVDEGRATPRRPGRKRQAESQPRAVAPYDADPAQAARHCFDRVIGTPLRPEQLKSYNGALAQYHLHPETKFGHADFLDRGPTRRRHVLATMVEHIGKEANRWEEQLYLGVDPEAQIAYGTNPEDDERIRGNVLRAGQRCGQRALARAAGVSLREVSAILHGEGTPRRETLAQLGRAAAALEAAEREQVARGTRILAAVRERCERDGLRKVARRVGLDAAYLSRILQGRRRARHAVIDRLAAALA